MHIAGHMKTSGIQTEHICDTVKEGLAFAESAIRLDNNSWLSHKWYAICCGTMSEMQGTNEKVTGHIRIKIEQTETIGQHRFHRSIYVQRF